MQDITITTTTKIIPIIMGTEVLWEAHLQAEQVVEVSLETKTTIILHALYRVATLLKVLTNAMIILQVIVPVYVAILMLFQEILNQVYPQETEEPELQ
jgi:hypothetical protein